MIKAWLRKWLGLKDTHHMVCASGDEIQGELISISHPLEIMRGDVIEIDGNIYTVESYMIKIKPPMDVSNYTNTH